MQIAKKELITNVQGINSSINLKNSTIAFGEGTKHDIEQDCWLESSRPTCFPQEQQGC